MVRVFSESEIDMVKTRTRGLRDLLPPVPRLGIAGRTEALIFDPVYSGKGLAGPIAFIRSGRWCQDEDVVFLHTGGEPKIFAYREILQL